MSSLRHITTRRSVCLEQHGVLISKVLRQPGPTHSLIDAMAATVPALASGPRIAMLGFAGGGIVAPLRAMGFHHAISAVDISRAGYDVFKCLCKSWSGSVQWEQADAVVWLKSATRRYHLIVEDLSVSSDGHIVKPDLIWSELPVLMEQRLTRDGVAVFNLLRPDGMSWKKAVRQVTDPFRFALSVVFGDFENRLVLAANKPLAAWHVSRGMHQELRQIGSRLAGQFSVRALPDCAAPRPPKRRRALGP